MRHLLPGAITAHVRVFSWVSAAFLCWLSGENVTAYDLLKESLCKEGMDGEVIHLKTDLALMLFVTKILLAALYERGLSAGAA